MSVYIRNFYMLKLINAPQFQVRFLWQHSSVACFSISWSLLLLLILHVCRSLPPLSVVSHTYTHTHCRSYISTTPVSCFILWLHAAQNNALKLRVRLMCSSEYCAATVHRHQLSLQGEVLVGCCASFCFCNAFPLLLQIRRRKDLSVHDSLRSGGPSTSTVVFKTWGPAAPQPPDSYDFTT